MRIFLIALGLVMAMDYAAAEQVFVCTDDVGKKTFQGMPCGSGVDSEVKNYNAVSPGAAVVPGRLATDSPVYRQMKSDNRRMELQRDIRKAERQIEKYQDSMEAEMAGLRSKKRYAANNQAGATWEQSISAEMQAVSSKYTSMVGVERDRINAMREELGGL